MKIVNYVPVEVDLNIGDKVVFDFTTCPRRSGYTVRRLVETEYGVYAVFNNGTWRPMSTYGKTWRKVEIND